MTKWLVAGNFLASTPCAFAVFSPGSRVPRVAGGEDTSSKNWFFKLVIEAP